MCYLALDLISQEQGSSTWTSRDCELERSELSVSYLKSIALPGSGKKLLWALPVHSRLMGCQLALKVLPQFLLVPGGNCQNRPLISGGHSAASLASRHSSQQQALTNQPSHDSGGPCYMALRCQRRPTQKWLAGLLTRMSLTTQGCMMPRSSSREAYMLSTLGCSSIFLYVSGRVA